MQAGGDLVIAEDVCEVRLRLIGRYLVVEDNAGCGGINVRFLGVFVAR